MCDTFIVMPEATEDSSVIFGKNSDREPNEAHQVLLVPAFDHLPNSEVRCTYRSIPQVAHTHAVLLMKPFWIWGAEMGANEYGVVIGNEAVFTRTKVDKGEGLIGMDFIRLALERASNADEALQTMVDLLEEFGQGGNCGFTHPFYYQNSFLIADRNCAWVLETSGKEWAAEKVVGSRSISNAITIGSEWTRSSPGLVDTAVKNGWSKSARDFNFARDYSEPIYTTFSAAHSRQACTTNLIQSSTGGFNIQQAFSTLRTHQQENGNRFQPDSALMGADVCMHAGWGPIRNSQSVGSLVAHLTEQSQTFWVTGTSAPCTSIFKPVWFSGEIPWQDEPAPKGTYDPNCLWWRHEEVHRRIIRDYPGQIELIQADQARVEGEALELARAARGDPDDLARISRKVYEESQNAECDWLAKINSNTKDRTRLYYRIAWNGFNRQAKLT